MRRALCILLGFVIAPESMFAQDTAAKPAAQEQAPIEVVLADGGLVLQAPGHWTKVQPKINMIEAEFAIPKLDNDPANGRVTIMMSGGSIEQNIDRWYGQFEQADGKDTRDVAKIEVQEVNKIKVHVVDISGSYLDTMGNPAGPKTARDNYRMLAAIIEAPVGNYYLKAYGPAPTIEKNVDHFKKMIESIRASD